MTGKRFALAMLVGAGAILAVPSCASVLGIEDLAPGGPDGGGGAGKTGAGGTNGTSGGSSNGGAAGASNGGAAGTSSGTGGSDSGGAAGTSGGSAGTGGSGTAGSGGASVDAAGGGAPDARTDVGGGSDGTGGGGIGDAAMDRRIVDAGEAGLTGITVQGTVIGYWRHKVADVDVHLGTRTTKTDASGRFTFTNVTPPYDIGLEVRGYRVAAWMFKGLTRSDPTLQVKDAFDPWGNTSGYHFQNFPAQSRNDAGLVPRSFMIAFGSPDTSFSFGIYQPDGTDHTYSYDAWEGPTNTTMGTVHALLWETPVDDTVSPTRYVAYDSKPVTQIFNTPSATTFDMSADNTPADTVSGSISTYATDRKLDGYVRYDSGAIMHIVSIANSPATFSMLMPKIANATVSVSAISGSTPDGPYAVAHRDGIAPGTTGIQLTVPAPPTLGSPSGGATGITASSMLQWNTTTAHVAIVAADCDGPTQNDYHTFFYTVTGDRSGQLPSLDGNPGIPLPKNRHCVWWVEVHGDYASVDAATTAAGMLDPYTYLSYGEFQGPARNDSTYTVTSGRGFTTAP